MDTNTVEQCRISPSGARADQSLPLIFFDMLWLLVTPIKTLHFYTLPVSKSHFFTTILPDLKNSLSLALKHFLPLSGNLIFPLNSGMPLYHYAAGHDSVPLTVAVSDSGFCLVTGNQPKDASLFHNFISELPSPEYSSDSIKIPVTALRITLFPDQGICIGVTLHHAIGDGPTHVRFLKTWASINRLGGDGGRRALDYDRTTVQDSDKLTAMAWEMIRTSRPTIRPGISFATNKVRATFILTNAQLAKLKNFILLKKPGLAHVSTYSAVCARVWSCLADSAGDAVNDDDVEYLSMPVDCRARLTPPLPGNYFGNCLGLILAESTHGGLRGKDGLLAAAEAIGEAIHEALGKGKGILESSAESYARFSGLNGEKVVGVSGSPRFDFYGVDFGWGGFKKFEALNIDVSGSFWLGSTRDGVEVGISASKEKMDAFAYVFKKKTFDLECKL